MLPCFFQTVVTCNEDSGGCSRRGSCIQVELGVTCSCDLYKESEENNMLARGSFKFIKI